MRSIAGIFVFILFSFTQLKAQRTHSASLKGTVIDSASRQPVVAATVSVFLIADSSLLNYAITNKKGEFLVTGIPQAKICRIIVSYSGLQSFTQDFVISPETKELIINTVQLRKSYAEMEEVIVTALRPPVTIKKDTIEFNASSFRTPVNGIVEDLLKQLPGIEVDAEGNITVNGKRVTKITVDGKDFFGSDFKIASKYLPKDIIDKVQIVDSKTREEQFNKRTTGSEDKAINLTLKKDKKRGLFGRASVGFGSDKRYESGGIVNFFNGPVQLSFVGYANNTSRMGISDGDFSMGKPASSFAGDGSGITETKAAGLNFNNEFNKKLQIGGSYFYGTGQMTNAINARRKNILPDTIFFYQSATRTSNMSDNHRLNLNVDYKPDSTTDLHVNAFVSSAAFTSFIGNDAASSSIMGDIVNKAGNIFTGQSADKSAGIEFFLGRRLNKRGTSFTLKINYNNNNRKAIDANKGTTIFYKPDGSSTEDTTDQLSNTTGKNNVFKLSTSWIEYLAPKLSLALRYSYSNSNGYNDKGTNRFNPLTGQYDVRDTVYSNTFRNRNVVHTPNVSFDYYTDKLNASIIAGMQWLRQENGSTKERYQVQRYSNLFPSINIGYRFNKNGKIGLNYNGRSQQPTIDQLQPVPDNSNTMYIILGNPDLKPAFFHSLNISLQQYYSKTYWNGGLWFSTTTNQIVYDSWFDSVQVSKPINSNGNYNFSYNINFSRIWKENDWSLRITLGNSGNYNSNVSFSNKVENIAKSYSISQQIGIVYRFRELINLMPSFIIRYNESQYSFEQVQPTKYINKSVAMNLSLNWPKRFILESNLQHNYNSRTAPGFPRAVTLWNIDINYQLFKSKQSIVRLSIYDLLKQSTSIYRTITPTFIEDTQVEVLQQYLLVSFIYNIKQFQK